jgi:tetratricopeptide (TPR) repeat protein
MSKERALQLIDAGLWLKLSGDYEGALRLFQQALKHDPDNVKAKTLVAKHGTKETIRPYESAPSANPFERPPDPVLSSDWGEATGVSGVKHPTDEMFAPVQSEDEAPMPSAERSVSLLAARTVFIRGTAGTASASPPHLSDQELKKDPAPPVNTRQRGEQQAAREPAPTQGLAQIPSPPLMSGVFSQESAAFEILSAQSMVRPAPAEPPPPPAMSGVWTAGGRQSSAPFDPNDFDDAVVEEPAVDAPSPEERMAQQRESFNFSSTALSEPAASAPSTAPIQSSASVTGFDDLAHAARYRSTSSQISQEVAVLLRAAQELQELDDHSGAMDLISKAHELAPTDRAVLSMKDKSEQTLLRMFESKLGKMETTPKVLLKDDEIIWLNLDHRAGFVLSQIDGTISFDDLLAVCGMPRIDTVRILAQLVDEGVISRG